jgi:polar amino acid transport system substrate-binding protein
LNAFRLSSCWLALLLSPLAALAQDKKPELRWGTDPTGGAPYIFQKENSPEYVGFEVEIADYLAAKLGRTSVMVDGDWSNLPLQLEKSRDVEKGIDIVLNGYELREDMCSKYAVTRPYYIYRLALVAKKGNANLLGWSDLLPREGRRPQTVCVLGGSVAQQYVETRFKDGVDLTTNTDVANVFGLVNDGRLDATVQDNPAADYFVNTLKNLHQVGEAVQPSYYVIYYRKSDPELGQALDKAIADGIQDGTFERIYRKYGIWNGDQERLNYWLGKPWPPFAVDGPKAEDAEKTNPWPRLIEQLLRAALVTIELSVASFPLAMLIGLILAVARVYGPWWLAFPSSVYVEVIRGTPLLLQLFMVYYLLPKLIPGLEDVLTPFVAGVIGLAINYSAYESENYRAGLLAIPRGQMEAALALGMTPMTALRRVVVPQAVRLVIPPVTNDFIALFKDTSACSVILVVELTRKYNELFNFNRNYIVELAFVTAGLYLLMSYPLALAARFLERRLGGGKGAHV